MSSFPAPWRDASPWAWLAGRDAETLAGCPLIMEIMEFEKKVPEVMEIVEFGGQIVEIVEFPKIPRRPSLLGQQHCITATTLLTTFSRGNPVRSWKFSFGVRVSTDYGNHGI